MNRTLLALTHPFRRDLLVRLVSNGPETITSLSRGRAISRQAVTKHLRLLHRGNLVRFERRGRELFVSPHPSALQPVAAWLERTRAYWAPRLAGLKHVAESLASESPPCRKKSPSKSASTSGSRPLSKRSGRR